MLERDINRQRSERKTQEKIIEGLRIKVAKARDSIEQQHLISEITQKEADLIEIPVLPLLFTNDATPESLTTLVNEQGGRLAIFSDEGGILETLAGLYSNGAANIDILLKGIDGGEVRVRRKDRSITLNPYLTIVLAVQPTEDAKVVFQWLRARNKPSFTQTEVVLAMRGKKLGKSERLQKALLILHERNILSAPLKIPTRKSTTLYCVNPILLSSSMQ
jgi:hypothetical protein